MAGFSFGASAIALFARVAGGIYTKAADVGADLVGKVEEDFPEDSYYNPATIADNVGDNVGDVAGMGADLFESYVGSIVAASTIAMTAQDGQADFRRVALPFWIAGFGVLASILGFFFVSTDAKLMKDDGTQNQAGDILAELLHSLHRGVYSSSVFIVGFTAIAVVILYGGDNGFDTTDRTWSIFSSIKYESKTGWKDFGCMVIGLVTGIIIGEATEFFTSYEHSPTRSITMSGVTGPATVIIQGLGIGMLSTVPPVLTIAAAILSTNALSGVYGSAIAAVGMLSTLGITLATDAYGPVADNAGGVAEMSHLEPEVRDTTDALDALGNTTAATGKGFAVGSAVLTALAFMTAFKDQVYLQVKAQHGGDLTKLVDFFALTNPLVLSGLLIGAMLPFLFAALTMLSVGKAATAIIIQVREQLADTTLIPGTNLRRGETLKRLAKQSCQYGDEGRIGDFVKQVAEEGLTEFKPDTTSVITICTQASLYEMIIPGILAIMTPIGVGLLIGARCLGGILMGAIASGFLLAVMMNNAGGAWDNSKKWVENDEPVLMGIKVTKKTKWHDAVVVGDTVGDPFKDTSGPALNILIKLMSVLSLTCAKIFRDDWKTWWVGLIVILIEAALCGVAFYYIWILDDTMEQMNVAGTNDGTTDDDKNPGVATEMVEVDVTGQAKAEASVPAADAAKEEAPAPAAPVPAADAAKEEAVEEAPQ